MNFIFRLKYAPMLYKLSQNIYFHLFIKQAQKTLSFDNDQIEIAYIFHAKQLFFYRLNSKILHEIFALPKWISNILKITLKFKRKLIRIGRYFHNWLVVDKKGIIVENKQPLINMSKFTVAVGSMVLFMILEKKCKGNCAPKVNRKIFHG